MQFDAIRSAHKCDRNAFDEFHNATGVPISTAKRWHKKTNRAMIMERAKGTMSRQRKGKN
jgi:hypothetical protein